MGQLQHVNVSSINLNPSSAIGNSLVNLYVSRTDANGQSGALPNDTYPGCPNGQFKFIYHLSYLLNKALWDGYFFSTVPPAVPASSQPGLVTSQAGDAEVVELKDANKAAAHLLVNGGFNINPTSVEAWRALLYSHNGVSTDPADPTNKKHP